MRQITLIKVHPSIQLGHLYEHIFCTQIKKMFYDRGLFKYLDYYLSGVVHDKGGVIVIEVEFYTSEARELASQIAKLEVSYTPEIIFTAFTQLLAEEERPLTTDGLDAITDALTKLHAQPWQNIDSFDIMDTKSTRQVSTPIYIADDSPLISRRLEIKLHLDNKFALDNRELLPLFLQIAKVLMPTVQDVLASANGYYGDAVEFKLTRSTVYMKAGMRVAHDNDDTVEIKDDLELYEKVFAHIKASGSLRRLVSELQNISYSQHPHLSPNIEDTFNDTGIYIGTQGWRKIATMENIERLLTHMSIEVIFGRKREVTRLIK